MEWPAALSPIRAVVFECLKCPEAKDRYFLSSQLAELCNIAAGVQALHGINKQKIGRAFSNGGVSDYTSDIDEDTEDFHHFYISTRFESKGSKYTAIGRFSSETGRIHALESLLSDFNSNVNIRSPFRQWDLAHIRHSKVGETFRSMYGDLSSESVVAQPRKRASSTQGSIDELHATEQNRLKIKADIAKLREELTKIEHRAIEIKELIRTKNNEVDEEVMLENEDANKTMNIIFDGRVTCIPRDDVIYMTDIVQSLLIDKLTESFDGGYRKMKLGSKEYLLPRGV